MKSIGTEYFEGLGLEKARDFFELRSILEGKIGKKETDTFISFIKKRGEAMGKGKALDEKEFYEFKNKSYESGIYASAAFDGEIIIKTCDWIADNCELFGKTILDVGCDTGIISCFLAKLLPESTIVSIDDGTNAIIVARKLAENLGLTNITFESINVSDVNEQYDTVFSSKTLHENLSANSNSQYAPFKARCLYAEEGIIDYLRILMGCIKPNGNLIALERLSNEAARTGYKIALNELGLAVDKSRFRTIECKTMGGETEHITASVATKVEDYDKENADAIVDEACKPIVEKATYNYERYVDEIGDVVLHSDQGDFIKGYYVYSRNHIIGKCALYYSRMDSTTIYFVQSFDAEDIGKNLLRYDVSEEEQLKTFLDKEASNFTKRGMLIREIDIDDDGNEIIIKNAAAERAAAERKKKERKKRKKKKK